MKLNEIIDPSLAKPLLKARRQQKTKSLEEIAKAYKQNIRAVLDKHLYFFRAADVHRPVMDDETELNWYEAPKRTVKRDSIFGNGNWLMSWVEATWANYPKRSMSYFATQSQMSAQNFGRGDQVLMIIPADDVENFGVMETDFNRSSTEAQTLMAAIQDLLKTCKLTIGVGFTPLLRKLDKEVFQTRGISFFEDDLPKPTPDNIKHFIDALDELLDNLFQIQQRSSGERAEEKLIKTLKEFRGELKEMGHATLAEYAESFSPTAMGARLYTDFRHIKSSPSKDDELWFEGSYLGIYWYGEDDTLENLKLLYDKL